MKLMTLSLFIALSTLFSSCGQDEFYGPKEDVAARKSFDAFTRKLAAENDQEFLNTGLGCMVDAPTIHLCVSLIERRAMTIDEARPIVVAMAQSLYRKVSEDPVFLDYYRYSLYTYRMTEEEAAEARAALRPDPMWISFKLAYWDDKNDRRQQPYLAQVRLIGPEIHYYYANPETQALEEPPIIERWIES